MWNLPGTGEVQHSAEIYIVKKSLETLLSGDNGDPIV